MRPSKKPKQIVKDLGQELVSLSTRLGPIMDEYFDGYLVLGQSAGDADSTMHIVKVGPQCSEQAIETMILAAAKEILAKRKNTLQ